MPDLHTDDWLDHRFDEAVEALDRVVTAPRPLSSLEFRRRTRHHMAGRAALAIGVAGGTVAALAFAARDSNSTTPATAQSVNTTQTTAAVMAPGSTPQSEAWRAAVERALETATGWPYQIESATPTVGGPGQVGGASVTATLGTGSLVFVIVPWAPGEYSNDIDWQREVAGVANGGESVAEGTLFISDFPPNRSASVVTPLALVSVIAQRADVDAIGSAADFASLARYLARDGSHVLAGLTDSSVDLDRLLYPTGPNMRVVEALTSPSIEGRFAATVLDPDGQPWTVSVAEDFWQGQTPPNAEQRDLDGLTFETHLENGNRVYATSNRCTLIGLRDPHAAASAWSDNAVALATAIDVRAGSTTLALPTGWSVLGYGQQPTSYNLRLDIDIDGDAKPGVLYQALDASPGSLLAEHQPSTANPIDINGRTGWLIEQDDTNWTYLGWPTPNGAALLAVENATGTQLRSLIDELNTGHADAWVAGLAGATLAPIDQPVPTTAAATPAATVTCDRTLTISTAADETATGDS